jgi:hypothetical protein
MGSSDSWMSDIIYERFAFTVGEDRAKQAVLRAAATKIFEKPTETVNFWRKVGREEEFITFDDELMRHGGIEEIREKVSEDTSRLVGRKRDIRTMISEVDRPRVLSPFYKNKILEDVDLVRDSINESKNRMLKKLGIGTIGDRKRQLREDLYLQDLWGTLTVGGISASALAFVLNIVNHAGLDRVIEATKESHGAVGITLGTMAIFGFAGLLTTYSNYGRNAMREVTELVRLSKRDNSEKL